MFIPDQNCPIKILTVLRLSWGKAVRTTGPRAFHALSYKVKGSSVYTSGGKELAKADTGDVLFCPKGIGYTQRHEESTVIVVHFDCPDDELKRAFEVFKVQSPSLFNGLFERMYDEWNSHEKGCEYKAASTFFEILYNLRQIQPVQDAGMPGDFDGITLYIDRNLSDPNLSVDGIATMCGCSESYLRRLFVKNKGLSPKQYITQMRLSLAKSLLKTGYFNVTETALKCGFSNQKHFSSMFMERFGLSPSDYRKKHTGGETEI